MSKIIILATPRGLTFLNSSASRSVSITVDHQNFSIAKQFTTDSDFEEVFVICSEPMRKVIEIAGTVEGSFFKISDDGKRMALEFHGQTVQVPEAIAKAIIELHTSNGDIMPLVMFLRNLADNPNKEIYEDLFAWMQSGNLTLTGDGHFLAYKKVREDYKDIFTGKLDNSVGSKPTMLRSTVTRDRNQTCAAGLHWCSWEYLNHYGSSHNNRIMIVKVNPANVDRIPTDYNRNKGVSWTYEVVAELEHEQELSGVLLEEKYDEDDDFQECEICSEDYNYCEHTY